MSLAESFLTTARDLLMMSENIKRMETRLDHLTSDLASVDRRVLKIELMIEISKTHPTRHPELP